MMPYRLQRIDFLPYMFAYEFVIMTRKPLQVPEYEALIYPFDRYIWIFMFSSMAVVSCTLAMLQYIWSTGPGEASPKDSTSQSEYLSSYFLHGRICHIHSSCIHHSAACHVARPICARRLGIQEELFLEELPLAVMASVGWYPDHGLQVHAAVHLDQDSL